MLDANPNLPALSSRTSNGINLDAVVETLAAIHEQPSIARFCFGAETHWVGGSHTRTIIRNFFGAGQNRDHQNRFELEADLPAVELGTDQGPSPAEYLLAALAACLVNSLVYQAACRGIRLEAVEVTIAGDLDIRRFLGLAGRNRAGYEEIRVDFEITSDATSEQLTELLRSAKEGSSIADVLTYPVPIRLEASGK